MIFCLVHRLQQPRDVVIRDDGLIIGTSSKPKTRNIGPLNQVHQYLVCQQEVNKKANLLVPVVIISKKCKRGILCFFQPEHL